VVTNASSIRVTGVNKPDQRQFKSYSGYPGGLHETSLREMLEKDPERVIREAVRRMLPKTRLGTKMLQKLKVYPGADHPHSAQQPEPLEL
jgi:large subunit ribosomal protein L13